jgi:hypothetical protein
MQQDRYANLGVIHLYYTIYDEDAIYDEDDLLSVVGLLR